MSIPAVAGASRRVPDQPAREAVASVGIKFGTSIRGGIPAWDTGEHVDPFEDQGPIETAVAHAVAVGQQGTDAETGV